MKTRAKYNYLSNHDLLREIHKSKLTYCSLIHPSYQDPHYLDYDAITDIPVTLEGMAQARKHRHKHPREGDLVFRVMTREHIPPEITKPSFPPFKHYILDEDDHPIEVLRSHWIGGHNDGHYSSRHGKLTNDLAQRIMTLVERYATRANWRNYSYNEEMRAQALMQLSQVALQFNESRSQNPFAYFTAITTNSFRRVLNLEKRQQALRDDMLEVSGHNPSMTRQIENQLQQADR